ncbi:MAG TPA: LysE family transporter [Pirellulaceae bacterium]|nr:LysE family transporter [Pirellulaceae bacterium]
MAFEHVLPLVLFAAVATITPGGATALATASGAHFGFGRSVPLMTGIAAGLASMAAAAALGLGGMLLALPTLQLALKAIGTLYLLWLAWRIGRSGSPQLDKNLARPQSFIGGIWLLWYNPKGWAMTSGAAVSFAALAASPAELAVLLGTVFGVAAIVSLSLWCTAGQVLARRLTADWQWRALNMLLAFLLAASIIPVWLP